MGEPVARKTVDDPERGAEIVVEAGPNDAGWQCMAHISDILANLIPGVGNFLRARAALQVDEDRSEAGLRIAAQEVQVVRFLQFALEPLCDLLERIFDACSGPRSLNDHRLDDECGILATAETKIGHNAGDDGNYH